MRIRVLQVQETVGSGGVERRRLSLAKYLNKEKFELKIICTQTQGPLVDEIRAEGVEVIEIGLLKKLWEFERYSFVLRIIKEFKPHIIHGAVFEGVLLSTIAGTIGRVPIIIAEETSDPANRSKKASLLLRGLTSLADKVVGVSPTTCDYLRNTAKVPSAKVELINNGVDPPGQVPSELIQRLRAEYGIKEGDIVIGSVGRIRNFHKRFTDLIEALHILKDKHPTLKVLLVGGGPDKAMIEEFTRSKGLSDRVIMAGYQHNPHPFFALMDIFAIVSHMEAFGLVAVEAMFHKLPVIATNVGGLKDVVVDQQTGFLVPRHEPDKIASAIDSFLSNKDLIRTMGSAGYRRAQSDYSAVRYVQDVENLYIKLLRQKNLA